MTYIIGARCTDGVVLISDQKAMRGNIASYKEKIIVVLDNVIMGGAGSAGLIEILSDEIKERVTRKQITKWDQLLEFIEDKSLKLSERYRYRIDGFDVLVGIRSSTKSQLYHIITNDGFAEPIKEYMSIGSGEPYGAFLLKWLWHKNMNMMDFAGLGYFAIKYVTGLGLNDSVGGDPIVWFIPDISVEIPDEEDEKNKILQKYESRPASTSEIEEMQTYSNMRLDVISQFIVTMRDEQSIIDMSKKIIKN